MSPLAAACLSLAIASLLGDQLDYVARPDAGVHLAPCKADTLTRAGMTACMTGAKLGIRARRLRRDQWIALIELDATYRRQEESER